MKYRHKARQTLFFSMIMVMALLTACAAPTPTAAPTTPSATSPTIESAIIPAASPTAAASVTPSVSPSPSATPTTTPTPTATPSPSSTPTPTATPTALPQSILLGPTNFQRQTFNNCGPTSIAILLGYYGIQVTQYQVNEDIHAGSVEGIEGYLSQFGLMARSYDSQPAHNAVRYLLANGIPVIVNQWLYEDDDSVRHYRVVRGYDDTVREFVVDDPLVAEATTMGYRRFAILSQDGWIIPIYPPAQDRLVRGLMRELRMHETTTPI